MESQAFDVTPEQLAVLIAFCRSRIHEYDYYVTPELQAVVEAISGPCFAQDDDDLARAINPDGWENFPSFLIDKCEGDTITEERLQHTAADMLNDPKYMKAAAPAVVVDELDNSWMTDELRESAPRAKELAQRLVASGPKVAHVSASETHEIADFIFDTVTALTAAMEGKA